MENTKEMDIPQVVNITKKQQVIAVLSVLSNCNQNSYEISEAALQQKATSRIKEALQDPLLTSFIGNWELVWGPCLKNSLIKKDLNKHESEHVGQFVTDNTMYVAKSQDPEDPTQTLYVIAVAGTNAISKYGWFVEDGKVEKMKAWKMGSAAKIAEGSSDGLSILMEMVDNNKNLLQFISSLSSIPNTEIATCGHSLGGALSPLVALKLIEWKEDNKISNFTVSSYPSAGPTSGNAEFAKYAETKLANNYHSIINNYDIVPHAWEIAMLDQIPSLYSSAAYGELSLTGNLLKILKTKETLLKINKTNYTRIFGRTINEYTFDGIPKDKIEPMTGKNPFEISEGNFKFLQQAAYQHTTVYNKANAFDLPNTVSNQLQKYIQP